MPATIDRHFRFTPELDTVLNQLCRHHGIDRTAVVKMSLLESARRAGLLAPADAPKKSRKKSA